MSLVRTRAAVSLAWRLRGGGWAKDTDREQFAGCHETSARAPRVNARAAELNPDDHSPYVSAIRTALGMGCSREGTRRIRQEATARDP